MHKAYQRPVQRDTPTHAALLLLTYAEIPSPVPHPERSEGTRLPTAPSHTHHQCLSLPAVELAIAKEPASLTQVLARRTRHYLPPDGSALPATFKSICMPGSSGTSQFPSAA